MQFIEQNLFDELSINLIAEASNLSVSSLNRHFKREVGVPVMQWREEKRINLACQKLLNSNKRMIEIADELGYANQMYFTRCFRRYMKMSPTDYRKQHGEVIKSATVLTLKQWLT